MKSHNYIIQYTLSQKTTNNQFHNISEDITQYIKTECFLNTKLNNRGSTSE